MFESRNLKTKRGLCKGTRLAEKDLKAYLIIAQVLSGTAKGHRVFILRVDLAPTTSDLPFVLRRRQFPVKLAFALTMNKAQGQRLNKDGIYLPHPVFTHGLLYAAFSCSRRSADVKVLLVGGQKQGKLLHNNTSYFTKNVVQRNF